MKRIGLLSACVMALSALGAGFSQAKSFKIKSTKSPETGSKVSNKLDQPAYQKAYVLALSAIYGDDVTPKYIAFEEGPFTAKNLKKPDWFSAWKDYVTLYMFSVLSGSEGVRAEKALSRLMGSAGSTMVARREFDMFDQCVLHKKKKGDLAKDAKTHTAAEEAQKKRDAMRLKLELLCAKLEGEANEVRPLLKKRAALWKVFTTAVRASDAYKDPKAKRFFEQKVSSVEGLILNEDSKSLNLIKKTCTFGPSS